MRNKNLLTICALLVSVVLGFMSSCDDEIVSKLHEYTPEEQAYKDSIEAARAGVKADYIYTQDIDLLYGSWTSTSVELDVAMMCEKLGYSDAAALKAAIGAFDGEVQLLAVNPKTLADYSDHQIDAAGVQEGFLFTAAGEPGTPWDWPSTASEQLYNYYCMYNVDDMTFYIGMRTGVLELGKTYKATLLWKKGTYRLAMIFNITLVEPDDDNANSYVADQTLTKDIMLVTTDINSDASTTATLDGDALASALGYANSAALSAALGELKWNTQVNNQVSFFGVNLSDGTDYSGSYTAGMGYWFNSDGDVCTYNAENAVAFADLDPSSLTITVGQKGGQVDIGETVKMVVMFANEANYRVAVELNVTTVEDAPPPGAPYELNITQTVLHPITTGWEQDFVDVTSAMRDAFKLTTAEIASAVAAQSMTFYAIEPDNSHKPSSSSGGDYPGHWFNPDGTVATNWQDGAVFVQMIASADGISFMFLNQPSNITSAATIVVKQTAELNGGKVNFTFNIVLTEGAAAPFAADYAQNINHIANDSYSTTDIDVTDVVTAAFQKSVTEIESAIGSNAIEFYALNSDNSQVVTTAEYPGHWFDANGDARSWGSGAFGCINVKIENERVVLKVYNFPGVTTGAATIHQVAKFNGGQVDFRITVNLVAE